MLQGRFPELDTGAQLKLLLRLPELEMGLGIRKNAVDAVALISHPNSAPAQWKFCPFCEFSSQPSLPRFLAQAAALSSPEIVRKEHPWH